MAIAPVVIEFLAKGMPQVQQAFQSIQASAVKAANAEVAATEQAGERKVASRKKTEKQIEAEIKRAAREEGKIQRQAMEEAERAATSARNQARANARKQDAKALSETQRLNQEKLNANKAFWLADQELTKNKNLAKLDAQKAAWRKDIEQTKNANLAKLDAQKAGWRQQIATDKKFATDREALAKASQSRLSKLAAPTHYKLMSAADQGLHRSKQGLSDLDAWQKAQPGYVKPEVAPEPKANPNKAFGRVVGAVVGAGAQGVIRGLQRSADMSIGLATTAAQLGGGFSIADSVMGEQSFRKQAAVLSASTLLAGRHASRQIGTDEIVAKAKAIAVEQNMDPSEVLGGFDKVKKLTGDLDKAMRVTGYVAKIARASGSDVGDVSGLTANILAANPKISDEDLYKQIRLFTRQGVVGGVELEDFAKYGSRIAAGATYFGGSKEHNEGVLGAMAQMSRQYGGANSAAEATLAAQRFGSDVARHSKDLKDDLGIDVRDGKGNLKDAQGIILEMLTKTNGDVTKLYSTKLGERGVKPLLGTAAIYKNAGGGEAGLEAVRREFAGYTQGTSAEEVDAANKRVMSEQGFEQAMLQLRVAAGEELLPAFQAMLPTLQQIIPQLVTLAKLGIPAFNDFLKNVSAFAKQHRWIIEDVAANPVGSLIALEVTKSFAAAGLPALLRGLFQGAFSGAGVPTPGSGVPGAAPGMPGATQSGHPLVQSGLLTAGLMAIPAMLGEHYATVRDAESRGKNRADEVSQMDPDTAATEIAKAQNGPGGFVGYGTKALQAANFIATGGTSYLTDKAVAYGASALGMDSATSVAELGITNSAMLEELRKISANTADGGGGGGNSGSGGGGRKDSIVER